MVTLQEWMDPARRRQRASSFGPAAELYDRVRPTYPAEAVAWALAPIGPGPRRVGDVGAGTGIMTRVLMGLGYDVVAIEPDDHMRARLVALTPDVTASGGSAEQIPLPDASLDAAVAAQAYHWFDQARANLELARVIRPGGVFAAIWNERDESVPWVREYSRIVEGDRGPDDRGPHEDRHLAFGNGFGATAMGVFHHAAEHTAESLVSLLKSRSYYLTASPRRQAELQRAVRELATSHPDLAGRPAFPLPLVTRVFRAVRP